MVQKNDMLSTIIQKALGMCISAGILGIFVWKMFDYLDPHYESKKEAKKKIKELREILHLDPNVVLNSHEIRLATQIVLPDEGANMDEIGGCTELLKQIMDNVIIPLRMRKSKIHFPTAYYSPPKGILLHGPPGCGKTLIARAIAKKVDAHFINFDISILNDMWYGETAKLTRALFTLGQKIQPCIIFIDEIDSVLRNRTRLDHEATAIMKTQFMALWDGFTQSDSAVVVIGATNRPKDVDDAILRRLPFKIHVPKPDLKSREEIIRVLLNNERIVSDFNYWEVAKNTETMSGSELKESVRLACLNKYRDVINSAIYSSENLQEKINAVKISHEDIIKAVELLKNSRNDLQKSELMADPLCLD